MIPMYSFNITFRCAPQTFRLIVIVSQRSKREFVGSWNESRSIRKVFDFEFNRELVPISR